MNSNGKLVTGKLGTGGKEQSIGAISKQVFIQVFVLGSHIPYSGKFLAGKNFAKARREVLHKNLPDLFSHIPTGSDFI